MSRDWWTMTWLVARRELADKGRTRGFWISAVILLLAAVAGAVIPAALHHGSSHTQGTARIAIVGGNVAALSQAAREAGTKSGTRVIVTTPTLAGAKAQLRAGTLDAALVDDSQVLVKQTSAVGSQSGPAYTLAEIGAMQKYLPQLTPADAGALAAGVVSLPVRALSPPGKPLAARITGLVAVILIYIILVIYGVRIAIGVGEEKTSRVAEVLLTTLRPVQLLAGKVIGMGLLAVGQVVGGLAVYLLSAQLAGSAELRGAPTGVILISGLWLVLGYAFYCTAYAAAGSLVGRQSEAQNAALPMQLILAFGYVMCYTVIYGTSVSPFFHVLTFIPFTAPVTMPVLFALGAPAWQLWLSVAITLASTVAMARLAGTIYERAILRTGGRVKVRQVLRMAA